LAPFGKGAQRERLSLLGNVVRHGAKPQEKELLHTVPFLYAVRAVDGEGLPGLIKNEELIMNNGSIAPRLFNIVRAADSFIYHSQLLIINYHGGSYVSYAIIRNVKYKLKDVGNISRHNERQNKQYGNPNVDVQKSKDNFHLKKPIEQSYLKEFERIRDAEYLLGNIRSTGKKQSNAVCEFIITSDSAFFEVMSKGQLHRFFDDCYDYVKQKCGEPYILSAVVHMDEKTPHMHVAYMPVVDGKDRKGNPCKRINCSEFWKGFNSYGILQNEFHRHITSRGYKLERGEVGSRAEHLTVAELKRKTLEKEIRDMERALGAAKQRFSDLENKVKGMEGIVTPKKRLDTIKPEPGMMGAVKGVSLEDIQNLKKIALEYYLLNEKMRDLSVKYVNLKSKVPSEAEKLETAKKLVAIQQLENDKMRLEAILHAHGIDAAHQDVDRNKEAER